MNIKYAKTHEWIKVLDDGTALVGISDHAQESLGDITFVEMPQPGSVFSAGDAFGVVESVKAASDIYMPVDAEVLELNADLEARPQLLNSSPEDDAWMIKVRVREPSQLDALMDAEAYMASI